MNFDLFNNDCLDVMPSIPSNSVDMILTDLPYGMTNNLWDKVIPMELLWENFNRILKINGACVLFGMQPFTSLLVNSNKNFKYNWIWIKNNVTGFLNAKKQPLRNIEDICVFYQKQCTYNPQMTLGNPYKNKKGIKLNNSSNYRILNRIVDNPNSGARYPTQILNFSQERGLHPTQKPVPLCEYLIKTYTNENDIVLDCCMGVGTVGVACKNTNRNFIGIELDKDYFLKAKQRIDEVRG